MSGGKPHGYGELNGAGRELLAFVSVNTATICNTWFKKKDIYKLGNIQNQNNGIALILLSLVGNMCRDVRVMRGAECNTDHKLLRMKLSVGKRSRKHKSNYHSCKRFDVSQLCLNMEDNRSDRVSTWTLGSVCRRSSLSDEGVVG